MGQLTTLMVITTIVGHLRSHLILTEEDYYTIKTSINLEPYLEASNKIADSLHDIKEHSYYSDIDNEARFLIRKEIHKRAMELKLSLIHI